MANVTINSQSINNVLTADIINMRDVGAMSEDQRSKLAQELAAAMSEHIRRAPLEHDTKIELEARTKALVSSPQSGDRQKQVQGLFATLRSCFGDATEIVSAAMKICQLLAL